MDYAQQQRNPTKHLVGLGVVVVFHIVLIWALVNGLARELGHADIRINALVPGWVITDKQRALWLDAEGEAEIARVQCLRGYLQADDLARAALFLAADDSRMCTGQSFIVDGGWV